jgi:hypothetical protein
MIIFLPLFLALLAVVGMTGYYIQLAVARGEEIARQSAQIKRQAEGLTLQAAEIAKLRQALDTSETQRADLIGKIQLGAKVARDQDSQIAQLRGLIAMDMQAWRRN